MTYVHTVPLSVHKRKVCDRRREEFLLCVDTNYKGAIRSEESFEPCSSTCQKAAQTTPTPLRYTNLTWVPTTHISLSACVYLCVYANVRTCTYIQSDAHPNTLNSRAYTWGHFLPEKLYKHKASYQWLWSNGCLKFKNSYDLNHNNFTLAAMHTGMQDNFTNLNTLLS